MLQAECKVVQYRQNKSLKAEWGWEQFVENRGSLYDRGNTRSSLY